MCRMRDERDAVREVAKRLWAAIVNLVQVVENGAGSPCWGGALRTALARARKVLAAPEKEAACSCRSHYRKHVAELEALLEDRPDHADLDAAVFCANAEAGRAARAEKHVAELEAEAKRLREALENLLGVQNGPPLLRRAAQWQAAFDEGYAALAEPEKEKGGGV